MLGRDQFAFQPNIKISKFIYAVHFAERIYRQNFTFSLIKGESISLATSACLLKEAYIFAQAALLTNKIRVTRALQLSPIKY